MPVHFLFPSFCGSAALLIALCLVGTPAAAKLGLTFSHPALFCGSQSEVTVDRSGAPLPPHSWVGSVRSASGIPLTNEQGGSLTLSPEGRTFYIAPEGLQSPTTFHIRVEDPTTPGAIAESPIFVMPRVEDTDAALGEWMLPETPGHSTRALAPRLSLLAGTEAFSVDPQGPGPHSTTKALRWLEGAPAMGSLNRSWLLAWSSDDGRRGGIKQILDTGELVSLPLPSCSVRALAVRPPGSGPEPPHPVVYAAPGRADDFYLGATAIWSLEPDLSSRIMAGGPCDQSAGSLEGAALEVRFGLIRSLAMGRDGTIYILDLGNRTLRTLSPDGQVRTLAGAPHRGFFERAVDGPGQRAVFGFPVGMALDPATEELYVSDRHAIRKVSREGRVSTVLGHCQQPGFDPGLEGRPVPPGTPCLSFPGGLQVHGECLFIADRGNRAIRVFNLKTRHLQTLAGHPSQRIPRLGPLSCFQSSLALEDCAAPLASEIAINPAGICVLDHGDGIAQLDLGSFE